MLPGRRCNIIAQSLREDVKVCANFANDASVMASVQVAAAGDVYLAALASLQACVI